MAPAPPKLQVILMLTSPLTTGWQVRNLQMGLQNNKYDNFMPNGAVDAQFGHLTAQAVYRAKFWLGYRRPNQVAGGTLRAILAGKQELGPLMKVLRAKRLAARAAQLRARPMRLKALDAALAEVGQTEHPANSNICKFTEWYGMNGQPWCAMFITFCMVKAGSKSFVRGSKYAYVPYIVRDGRDGANHLTITHDPQAGDIVTYDWDGDGVADHVGFFKEWNSSSRVAFTAVEGNTSGSSNSNGGIVMVRPDRVISEVLAFIHVGG